MADISKIEINGETYDIKDTVARESGGGDEKIVHGSFGEWGELNVTGAGMIILCGDNSALSIYSFTGSGVSLITGSTGNYDYNRSGSSVTFTDNYGFTETLYTIIYA